MLYESVMVLNDQGGSVMEISYDIVGTLRAQDHGHPPLVLCKTYPVESHPQDSRMKIAKDDVCQALTGKMGTGGGVMFRWC
jgi:DNA (cytosine-5)-methyltransferase 1